MENTLRNLLDKTYELEGLIHLALNRDSDISDLLRLISQKCNDISRINPGRLNLGEDTDNEKQEVPKTSVNSLNNSDSQPFSLDEYAIEEDRLTENIEEVNFPDKEEEKEDFKNIPQKGKLVFTINERFRFKKELFDNSDADFNNTLALVASMEDYDEAEDYFINEMNFMRNNPIVEEFLNVIKRYFK